MKKSWQVCFIVLILLQQFPFGAVLNQNKKKTIEKVNKSVLDMKKIQANVNLSTKKNLKKEKIKHKEQKMLQEIIRRHDQSPNFFGLLARYGKRYV